MPWRSRRRGGAARTTAGSRSSSSSGRTSCAGRRCAQRFAEIHTRVQAPLVAALERHADDHGYELPDDPHKLMAALYAMQLGLSLERLTLPELVDERLGQRMGRLFLDDLARRPGRR